MGLVAHAVDLDLGRAVALKRLKRAAPSEGEVARFVREVRLLGRLEHPSIVPLYDVDKATMTRSTRS